MQKTKHIYFLILIFFAQTAFSQVSETTVLTEIVSTTLNNKITSNTVIKEDTKPLFKTFGEFRYRHQVTQQGQTEKRTVHRLSFKVGQSVQLLSDLNLTYRLMTGTSHNSSNITLDEKGKNSDFQRQSIGLDQAFITYQVENTFKTFLGKMPQYFNTVQKNQILLDRDITPEGYGLQYEDDYFDKSLKTKLNLGSFWVLEKYDNLTGAEVSDSMLNIAQIHLYYKMNNSHQIEFTAGKWSYTNIKDERPDFILSSSTNTSAKGNTLYLSVDGFNYYAYQYEMDQIGLEYKYKINDVIIGLGFESIKNTMAPTDNLATYQGVSVDYKKWTFQYGILSIQADSVFAFNTDSDFADGQTVSRGSQTSLFYKVNSYLFIGLTQIQSEQNVSTFATPFNRTTFDVNLKF